MTPLDATGYLAAEGFETQLAGELKRVAARHGRLFLAEGPPQRAVWAQNIWLDPVRVEARSIGAAAAALKSIQRNWWPYTYQLHRRTALLTEQLPHVAAKPLAFPAPPPAAALGSFTLTSQDELIAAARCASPFPNGEATFEEFHAGPPSRAYLKLFEALTLLGARPEAGARCLELGASPGGWTWVLARLGCLVTAYDRAPLAPEVAATPGVTSVKGDAFTATPDKVGKVDWLFSDVICYPERLYEHIRLWLDAGTCRSFVCTVKFQGAEHYGVIDMLAGIPGSRLLHLFHNKHELTWTLVR